VSSTNRTLDDLDRLSFRLARIIRQNFPQLATQGFSLTDLEERLLPYRETRREMADGGADSWERAMLRLLSGERGLLVAEPELRDASRNALALPSPTLALVRSWSSSLLTLGGSETEHGGIAGSREAGGSLLPLLRRPTAGRGVRSPTARTVAST
jgi:hypothetical protein